MADGHTAGKGRGKEGIKRLKCMTGSTETAGTPATAGTIAFVGTPAIQKLVEK